MMVHLKVSKNLILDEASFFDKLFATIVRSTHMHAHLVSRNFIKKNGIWVGTCVDTSFLVNFC